MSRLKFPRISIRSERTHKPQIKLGEKVRRTVIIDNLLKSRITNRSQGSVKIGNNAAE